jgi:DNA-binding cell septation regulator SpoVG
MAMQNAGIEITQVQITPVHNSKGGSLQAFAKVVLNGQFVVNSIRIVKGKSGPFVSFPREYNPKEGKGYDLCHPITGSLRSYMTQKILNQYQTVSLV